MTFSKIKKYLYSSVIIFFLVDIIVISFMLDKELLTAFGIRGILAFLILFFYIGLKILTEFFYFRIKGVKKWLIGSFSFSLILLSVVSVFFVRLWKMDTQTQLNANNNIIVQKMTSEADQNRALLLSQIKILDTQIVGLQKEMTRRGGDYNTRWLIHDYTKRSKLLSDNRLKLVNQLRTPVKSFKKDIQQKKETSLHDTINRVIGIDPNVLTVGFNLLFALVLDFGMLFCCFAHSYINENESKPNEKNSLPSKLNENQYSIVNSMNTIDEKNSLLLEIETAQIKSGLNKSEFAKKEFGISKQNYHKIISGKTKKINESILNKMGKIKHVVTEI